MAFCGVEFWYQFLFLGMLMNWSIRHEITKGYQEINKTYQEITKGYHEITKRDQEINKGYQEINRYK